MNDPVVYRRTAKGQAAAVQATMPWMNEDHRGLLLLVNGYTPLDALGKVAQFQGDVQAMAIALEDAGLIEQAHNNSPARAMHKPWRIAENVWT